MVKITEKQVVAFRQGLDHGVLANVLEFRNYHNDFLLKRERDAYRSGHNLALNGNYVPVYRKGGSPYRLVEYAIECGDIAPIGWEVYHNPFYHTFSIETIRRCD